MVLGICGGSGSGKTYLAERLCAAVGADAVAYVQQDSYYRDLADQDERLRAAGNFDHPDCIDADLLAAQVAALRSGQAVETPRYDFATHARLPQTRRQEPRPVVVVEGTLLFCYPALRERLDLKVFVDADPDLRLLRRIRRDVAERGRSLESVLDQWEATVRPMHHQFIDPSKRHADLIVPEGAGDAALDLFVQELLRRIALIPPS